MIRSSSLRSFLRASVCLAVSLTAPACFGAGAPKTQAQAQLLDHAEFLCSNCFFGASDYYYCFAADNKILIGYQKTPVLNYTDKSKNYFTGVRPRWAAWSSPSETVPLSYDDKHIWVSRPEANNGPASFWAHLKGLAMWATRGERKQVRLKRSSMADIFINDSRCRGGAPRATAH